MDWESWAERWEHFQECYVPERETQLSLVLDEVRAGSDSPTMLDIGAGPGSLARRAADRFERAVIVAVDLDPWLIEMGRAICPARVAWVSADLRDPQWTRALPRVRFDAIVSATALHWIEPSRLGALYGELARLLRPEGILVNADTIPPGNGMDADARAARGRLDRWRDQRTAASGGETWHAFWRAARREPEFRELLERRDRELGPRPPRVALATDDHAALLKAAGFQGVAELWRRDAAAILRARVPAGG